jgi:hypothetical protein
MLKLTARLGTHKATFDLLWVIISLIQKVIMTRVTRKLGKNSPKFWKKVAQTVAKPKKPFFKSKLNVKVQNI